MKAIVNTKSNYRNLNGLTFPIVEFLLQGNKPGIALEIPVEGTTRTADFALDEVTIVDLQNIYQEAYAHHNWGGPSYCTGKHYADLKKYAELKGIDFKPIFEAVQ